MLGTAKNMANGSHGDGGFISRGEAKAAGGWLAGA